MPFIIALALTFFTLSVRPELIPHVSSPTVVLSPTPIAKSKLIPTPSDSDPWGTAIKVGEHTYKIKVQNDAKMGTKEEILSALNDLRKRNGAQPLTTDPRLCEYTQARADYFFKLKDIDSHAGFEKFLDEEDGFNKLGFRQLGENSSYGYIMSGVHLIEFVYMQSPAHNKNQLDPKWDKACVGIAGSATNLIFATSPM